MYGAMTAVIFVLALVAGLIFRGGLKAIFAAVGIAMVFRFALNRVHDDDAASRVFVGGCFVVITMNVIAIMMRRAENIDPNDPRSTWWWPFDRSDDDD